MNALVGDDLNVNIEQEEGRLFFRLWKNHRWGSYTLYYFPVKFLESLNPVLRRIAITFLHKLMRANSIGTFLEDYDTDCMFEMLSECDDCDSSREWKRTIEIAGLLSDRQNKAGCSGGWSRKSYYKDLPKPLKRTLPKTGLKAP